MRSKAPKSPRRALVQQPGHLCCELDCRHMFAEASGRARKYGRKTPVPKTVCIDHLSSSPNLILEVYSFPSKSELRVNKMWQVKTVAPWAHKLAVRSLLLAGATTLLGSLALAPKANAQIAISITPPVCMYGYYGYAPYGCAPSGYYGPGYFYGGVFLGVGPWANWGYGHGWGEHRFSGGGGGTYRGVSGNDGGRGSAANRGNSSAVVRTSHGGETHSGASARNSHEAAHSGASHAAAARGGASHDSSHAAAAHGGAPHGNSHAAAAHGASHGSSHAAAAHGGASHGGESHGGGSHGGSERH
jgi:hypothetical protein